MSHGARQRMRRVGVVGGRHHQLSKLQGTLERERGGRQPQQRWRKLTQAPATQVVCLVEARPGHCKRRITMLPKSLCSQGKYLRLLAADSHHLCRHRPRCFLQHAMKLYWRTCVRKVIWWALCRKIRALAGLPEGRDAPEWQCCRNTFCRPRTPLQTSQCP